MTQDTPVTVSFIIAAYNVADFIGRALESVLNQTVPPREVIVIDDGSTDQTADAARRSAEESQRPELLTIIRQANAGVSVARNVGLDAATGDYVVFVDGDDWVELDLIEQITPTLATWPDMVHWRVGFLDQAGQVMEEMDAAWQRVWPATGWQIVQQSIAARTLRVTLTGGIAWRLALLHDRGLRFHPGCPFGEDRELIWKSFAHAGPVAFVDARLAWYYYRTDSASRSPDIRRFHGPAALLRAADVIASCDQPDAEAQANLLRDDACSRYMGHLYAFVTLRNLRGLFASIEEAAPGVTEEVRAHLRSKPAPRPQERLLIISPHAVALAHLVHRGFSRGPRSL